MPTNATPNLECRRCYSRGYNAGSRQRWPEYHPPLPPNEVIAELMRAALSLRDAVDGQLATLDEDDPWQESLGNPMDEVTEALTGVTKWLKKAE